MTGVVGDDVKAMRKRAEKFRANIRRLRERLRKLPPNARHKARRMVEAMQSWLERHAV